MTPFLVRIVFYVFISTLMYRITDKQHEKDSSNLEAIKPKTSKKDINKPFINKIIRNKSFWKIVFLATLSCTVENYKYQIASTVARSTYSWIFDQIFMDDLKIFTNSPDYVFVNARVRNIVLDGVMPNDAKVKFMKLQIKQTLKGKLFKRKSLWPLLLLSVIATAKLCGPEAFFLIKEVIKQLFREGIVSEELYELIRYHTNDWGDF